MALLLHSLCSRRRYSVILLAPVSSDRIGWSRKTPSLTHSHTNNSGGKNGERCDRHTWADDPDVGMESASPQSSAASPQKPLKSTQDDFLQPSTASSSSSITRCSRKTHFRQCEGATEHTIWEVEWHCTTGASILVEVGSDPGRRRHDLSN
ncbi:hypothetical protein CAPTEDRAFT_190793 [Capitella teleta]|uniref:Uncharacterized protein n=1 Tax=Capitella teleta TaxID=283909 RepID=R7TNF3_CAPTE|nr:hypothetical protein CAPTEDRAFT_190793 [Capitella teleta]|eukprot:ELT95378.1 hypothetical protein CAPTEDRAFT_190793 [Capitella teleta]